MEDPYEDDDSDSDDSAVAFATTDFSGVNFDEPDEPGEPPEVAGATGERLAAFGDFSLAGALGTSLASGQYAQVLKDSELFVNSGDSVRQSIRQQVILKGSESVDACFELELVGVAALNLFLQSNYTGPSPEGGELDGINPHPCFVQSLRAHAVETGVEEKKEQALTEPARNTAYQNAVLAELAVDGEWPCQVCHNPYFLLVARAILLTLADPERLDWTLSDRTLEEREKPSTRFIHNAAKLQAACLWSGRAIVAHERLLQAREPATTLWLQAEATFQTCLSTFCPPSAKELNAEAATVMLEWGLAQHYFDRPGMGRSSFEKAQTYSGMQVEVTGVIGKRTKFQQEATAQMVVRAKSTGAGQLKDLSSGNQKDFIKNQMVQHSEEGILLERVKFEEEKENEIQVLSVLDQSILLALCLDVKNSNPADGLTGEEMGAFLSRVLDHQDDWMVYSTALLERSWLEFERSHARERSILQIQALADQHTNRLTITQSTRESVENSAPVQERLCNLHSIVYPPRWLMIQDLADRYASLGIVTSAAELFTEVELWDSVVECYRRAGRVAHAEKIVRERLAVDETPRMWAALGDITKDPAHYEKAIEVSKGRYSDAYLALGEYYSEKGQLKIAAENFEKALKVRTLVPAAWFRLGAISMKLGRWQTALQAFSEVVMQEPEEADAWANIAAVHMHNKQPSEAYPALNEALKHKRTNWRVWISKLYTCLDLEKYDEAVQACTTILDLRSEKQASDGIPPLEEKCVRAIVGGALKNFQESKGDEAALDSSRRTLSRVHTLLDRLSSSSEGESWVFETMAFLQERTGQDSGELMETLMKEYRLLQANTAWEKDNAQIQKLYQVVTRIFQIYKVGKDRADLTKARFLVSGAVQKIQTSRPDDATLPDEAGLLKAMLVEVEEMLQQE